MTGKARPPRPTSPQSRPLPPSFSPPVSAAPPPSLSPPSLAPLSSINRGALLASIRSGKSLRKTKMPKPRPRPGVKRGDIVAWFPTCGA
mmetsp:Transcript_13953/g.26641  ORF Transcript_13953/g.26641 Transcript_13953/m.26641 type:complete len:89 (+) Transcript_13953:597-863(+)